MGPRRARVHRPRHHPAPRVGPDPEPLARPHGTRRGDRAAVLAAVRRGPAGLHPAVHLPPRDGLGVGGRGRARSGPARCRPDLVPLLRLGPHGPLQRVVGGAARDEPREAAAQHDDQEGGQRHPRLQEVGRPAQRVAPPAPQSRDDSYHVVPPLPARRYLVRRASCTDGANGERNHRRPSAGGGRGRGAGAGTAPGPQGAPSPAGRAP